MYSGTTFTNFSGSVLGAHQKIDRTARRVLKEALGGELKFPSSKMIIHFEGKNGPDGIKRKSPAVDEPWHYFDPFDDDDLEILKGIEDHFATLTNHLKKDNQERIAFEAAWLAHGLVDGLTPAHHYPYEKHLEKLRDGKTKESRTTYKEKLVMHGKTPTQKIKNNWEMWGPRGLFMSHTLFEMGVAAIIAPLGFGEVELTKQECDDILKNGISEYFTNVAREIAVLDIYQAYQNKGWTPKLAWQIRHRLAPALIKMVALSWYAALVKSGQIKGTK